MRDDIDTRLVDYWLDSRDKRDDPVDYSDYETWGSMYAQAFVSRWYLSVSLCLALLVSSCATLGALDDLVSERVEYYLENYELVVAIRAEGETYDEIKEALECVVEDTPACEGVSEEERKVLEDSLERTSETREPETVSGSGWEVQIEPVEPLESNTNPLERE